MTWTARATDDFNRADGGLGSNWTALNGATFPALTIVSNQIRAGTAGVNRNGGWYNAVQPRSAQYAKITLRDNLATGDEAGLLLRCRNYTGGFDAYHFAMLGGASFATASINRFTNAGISQLKQILSLANLVSGDVLMFSAEGTSLIGYVNGAPVIAIGTDTTWHSGYAGILILVAGSAANLDLDDFEAGDLDFGRGI